ncbi:hypothetical protein D3C73_637470 [compost metagenome]
MGAAVVVTLGIPGTFRSGNSVLAQHQVIHRCGVSFRTVGQPYFHRRDDTFERSVPRLIKVREDDFFPLPAMAFYRKCRINLRPVFLFENKVPFLIRFPALPHRSVRHNQLSGDRVINHRFPVRMLRGITQIACPQEPAAL